MKKKTVDIIFSKDLAEAIFIKAKKKKMTPIKYVTSIVEKEVIKEIKAIDRKRKRAKAAKTKVKSKTRSRRNSPNR